jgi:hypothetical protein
MLPKPRKTDGGPMKLEKFAAVAEIISSVAIVITLIYLALQTQQLATQTQQTNDALLATSRQATMSADVSLILAALDPAIAELEYIQDEEMTVLQRQLRTNYLAAFFRVREFAWFQYQNDILDEATLRSYLASVPRFLGDDSGAQAWRGISAEIDPEFVEYIEQFVNERP